MAQAPNYTPTTSFSNDETNNASGRSTVRTVSVDAEFANVSTSVNAINTNLQLLQRDDGNLLDFIVEPFALSETTRALLTGGQIRGDWAPYTLYAQGDITRASGAVYIALNDHTSGPTFVSTLWMSLSQSGDALAAANAASAAAAQASLDAAAATAATASKLDKAGGTMAGALMLAGDASSALHAVPMRQVVLLSTDQAIAGIKTFGSSPVLPGDAVSALQAVPKQQLDALESPWYTGDTKDTFQQADHGKWLLVTTAIRTIGSATSGATARANADTSALFTLLWGALANTDLPIQDNTGAASTRGASAAADFAANKRLPLPSFAGLTKIGYHGGDGTFTTDTTSRLGQYSADAVGPHHHETTMSTGPGGSNYAGNYAAGLASIAGPVLQIGGNNVGTGTENTVRRRSLNIFIHL
jgi:hypothetical protein